MIQPTGISWIFSEIGPIYIVAYHLYKGSCLQWLEDMWRAYHGLPAMQSYYNQAPLLGADELGTSRPYAMSHTGSSHYRLQYFSMLYIQQSL